MTKRSYEKPSILKHNEGLANKFGTTSTRRTCASIEGIPVADLANEFGTPVFLEFPMKPNLEDVLCRTM